MRANPHMVRVAQIVVGVLVGTALLLAGLGALLPRRWHVEERIMINAPPAAVHSWVNDLRHFPEWAQWNQAELAPKNQLSSPSSGPGATLTWYGRSDGNEPTSGEVRIQRSDPELGVWFENRTHGGDPSHAQLTYVLRPNVTEVIWRDEGQLPPIVGGLFLDLFQKRLSQHMVSGLERLKELVELGGRVDPRVLPSPAPP
jgi:polyketide cyclase/dehydrase/lipid transport protein